MERFHTLFFVAGVGCFAVAIVLSMVFPWMTLNSYHGMDFQTLEDLAAEPSAEFRQLAADFPEAFQEVYGEVSSESYAQALRLGRDVYVGQACWHCHSQYVRVVSNEAQRFGPPSTAQEYQNALHQPHLWGTRRVGPDLTHEGGLRSNDWHTAHFWNPQAVSPGSVMPRYRWFLEEGFRLVRGIDPDVADRNGLSPDTVYPIPGVYPTEAEAEQARERHVAGLPPALAGEAERIRVAEGRTLNSDGLAVVSYLQWLGTWQPPSTPEN